MARNRTPRTPRTVTAPAVSTGTATVTATDQEVTVPSTVTATAHDYAASAAGRATVLATAYPEPTSTAIVPVAPSTPGTYAAGILRALLAGDELTLDPAQMALAIGALESAIAAPAPRAATATGPRVLREAPEARAAAVANGLPTRKIWRTKAYGPLLVGACNAAGGAVVRDTRESYPASDVWAGQKVSAALAFIATAYPEFTTANATPEALARIGADGVAR